MATQETRIKAFIDAIAGDVVILLNSLTASGVQPQVSLDAGTDAVTTVTINDDDGDTATWPNRWEWMYRERTGGTLGTAKLVQWINEYGELRLVGAKANTVALRIYGRLSGADSAHTGNVFEVQDNRTDNNVMFGIDEDGNVDAAGTITSAGAITRDVPSGPTLSTGYIILSAAASVPSGTPANTVIFRTAT